MAGNFQTKNFKEIFQFLGDLVAVGSKVALLPILLGIANFLVHHIHANVGSLLKPLNSKYVKVALR